MAKLLVSQSQIWGSERSIIITAGQDSVFLDSLPVLSSHLHFTKPHGDTTKLEYTLHTVPYSYIIFKKLPDHEYTANFQVLDLAINKKYSNKDTSLILPETALNLNPTYEAKSSPDAFDLFTGLNSSGSISRGVLVGNNQDAVLNSNLNLQLSGDIGEGTQIRASITDNNLPIQTDGYTQQLQEFDKVYIELENADFGLLRAGDYNINQRENPHLSFDKRITGAGVFSKVNLNKGFVPIQFQGGIARGKYARNQFMGEEGNQGPYKLKGNNNEQFIIIISGTERVYIDGKLLTRGQKNDYTIDYNAGEITFTALSPITKEKRIVVEFQYAEQNYLRTLAYAETGYHSNGFKTTIKFYNEQDSKNQTLVEDYSDEESEILAQAGDDATKARVSSILPATYNENLVLYELKDSLGIDSILVYSTDSSVQLYSASFAYVGLGRGNYQLASNNANGRVFEWLVPIGGVPQGSYEPIKQLQAPVKLQVLSLQTQGKISKDQNIKAIITTSENDQNLLSDLDKKNDRGVALYLEHDWKKKFKKGTFSTEVSYDFNDDNFRSVERLRNIEFSRDWNIPLNYQERIHLASANVGVANQKSSLIVHSQLLSLSNYQGYRNGLSGNYKTDKNLASVNFSWLNTTDSITQSNFIRERVNYAHYLKPQLWVGVRSIGEWNKRSYELNDSIVDGSYNFIQYQFYAGLGDSTKNFTELSYLERWDDTAQFGAFSNYSKASIYGLKSQYKTNFNSTLLASINYRTLQVFVPEKTNIEHTVTTRLNYIQRLFKNSIISTSFYETGSGNEAKRSFSYIEVPAGTGYYTHTDYNGNGLQELDEFEVAPTPDLATYVRVYQQSNEYVRTNLLKLGQNLVISAPSQWKSKDDIRAQLQRFSLLFNYQLDRKTLLTGNSNNINPFEKIEDDSLIVGLNNNFKATLFFNRAISLFGADYSFRQTDNRSLLSFGVEQLAIQENTLNIRVNPVEVLLLKGRVSLLEKNNTSSNFSTRNYVIDDFKNLYSLAYQPSNLIVITGRYEWSKQSSTGEVINKLDAQTIGIDLALNRAEKISAIGAFNYILNDFEGEQNSPSAYDMLQALQPGKNATWTLTLQKTIKKNLLVSLNYNGRVSATTSAIHTGNIEIKAFF